ncbi:hypothetical protein O6H91_14G047400 [Diphasiastrum complanatum]|uniref:Uncharacterized protein n=1 Tax=Diphasiastrum complanatum TaxID=34168 RepID=A0ACC2BP46_DIPCM|nr:hypothetical protein O6H91_14G047400 [Diphasiastrum complanatum]
MTAGSAGGRSGTQRECGRSGRQTGSSQVSGGRQATQAAGLRRWMGDGGWVMVGSRAAHSGGRVTERGRARGLERGGKGKVRVDGTGGAAGGGEQEVGGRQWAGGRSQEQRGRRMDDQKEGIRGMIRGGRRRVPGDRLTRVRRRRQREGAGRQAEAGADRAG